MAVSSTDTWKAAVVLILAAVLVRVMLSGAFGLSEDEAYYWVWGQHLAAGYFDHPPAIAWVIRAGTELLGDTERGVRLVGILLGGAAAGLAAAAGRDRLLVAFAMISLPLFALGGVLATPDVPLLAAWSLGILAASRERWELLGVACGLAMLSKYTGVLLLPLV
ncbi:MAG: glycosyltransferase family 39 protein, partial [Myxococcota bacterium]|nr:glycosyltransferase family 39 protein [Myxococcota bacterium]